MVVTSSPVINTPILLFIKATLLLIGTLLILEGFRIFKFFIVLQGVLVGGTIGALFGYITCLVLLEFEPLVILALMFLGMLFGGMIAWYRYIVGIFFAGGMVGGLIGVMLAASSNRSGDLIFIMGSLFFIIAGIFAVKLHKQIIIWLMALYGIIFITLPDTLMGNENILTAGPICLLFWLPFAFYVQNSRIFQKHILKGIVYALMMGTLISNPVVKFYTVPVLVLPIWLFIEVLNKRKIVPVEEREEKEEIPNHSNGDKP